MTRQSEVIGGSKAMVANEWELVRYVNGRPWSRRLIGYYILTESTRIEQYGEYAADYWTIEVQPGEYPVYACRDCGQRWHSLLCEIPGVIVSGSWWNKLEPGEPRSAHINLRAYDVARTILNAEPCKVRLCDDVEPREIRYEYQGKTGLTHGLFCGDEQF